MVKETKEIKKILFETKRFDVIKSIDKIGIDFKKITVGVLPYTIDNSILSSVGVLHEYNSFREEKYCDTLITGTVDPDDLTLLQTAMRELHEEGGIACYEIDRWIFLGSMRLSKSSNEYCHVFAADVTNIEIEEAKGDGSYQENNSKFKLTPINDAILTDEAIFLASYLRLFDFFYQKNK
jgi:8-oxo-dGTP pyrophosphatase MutT (NUDIX family)